MVDRSLVAVARSALRRVAWPLAALRAFFWIGRNGGETGPDVVVISKDGFIETTDLGSHGNPLRRVLWRMGIWSRRVGLKEIVKRVVIVETVVFCSTVVFMALGYLSVDAGLVPNRSEGVKGAYTLFLFVFVFVPMYVFNGESKTRPMLFLFLFSLTWLTFLVASHVGSVFFLTEYESVVLVGGAFFVLWFFVVLLSLGVGDFRGR